MRGPLNRGKREKYLVLRHQVLVEPDQDGAHDDVRHAERQLPEVLADEGRLGATQRDPTPEIEPHKVSTLNCSE